MKGDAEKREIIHLAVNELKIISIALNISVKCSQLTCYLSENDLSKNPTEMIDHFGSSFLMFS